MDYNKTIVAQATPLGYSGIGILRVSGFKACEVAKKILGKLPKPRYANYLPFRDIDGSILDQGIALWFPSPNSFTGEDVLELHGHGGPIILDLLLKRILTLPEIRIARPGEFSERAFLNNKLDLAQAEAIVDLINANSEQTARSALNSLQGKFSARINNLVKTLTYIRVNVEAAIDFSNEKIDLISNTKIKSKINKTIDNLNIILKEAERGSLLREGIKVVIAGNPNTGKSSLFNMLVGREAAIVTDIIGTTRDTLYERINIDGIPINIIDTAGLHDSNDIVECIGIKRAWQEIKEASLVLFVVDSVTTNINKMIDIYQEFISYLPINLPITIIRNKVDISKEKPGFFKIGNHIPVISLSTKNKNGIDILQNHLKSSIGFNSNKENFLLIRQRHLQALRRAIDHLTHIKIQFSNNVYSEYYELLAEELNLALQALGEITGKFTSNDLLRQIFSNFCIGK